MRDQLLGATQPMLSILLDPGESVIGEVSRFAWMTDSIEMAVADETGVWVYTATGEPGVVAFAATTTTSAPRTASAAVAAAFTPCRSANAGAFRGLHTRTSLNERTWRSAAR